MNIVKYCNDCIDGASVKIAGRKDPAELLLCAALLHGAPRGSDSAHPSREELLLFAEKGLASGDAVAAQYEEQYGKPLEYTYMKALKNNPGVMELPENNGGYTALKFGKTSPLVYDKLTSDHPIDLTRYQALEHVANWVGGLETDLRATQA